MALASNSPWIGHRYIFAITLMACASLSLAQQTTEEELSVLTISGNLIGSLGSVDAEATPESIINSYYALLPAETRNMLEQIMSNMNRRSIDYQVAFRSGDTAEINEIVDELSYNWASIRTVHAREFTEEVISELTSAYAHLYEFIGGEE